MHYCAKCRKQHPNFKVIKKNKGKRGRYYPYRDSMDAETYTYTEVIVKCLVCGEKIKVEKDTNYEMSETRFEKYGRHSHYGT